jgi:predicted transcriptional regulator
MRARDIMSRPVTSVDTATTVREAITVLTENGFATVPVVDGSGRVVGIFSESDGLRADPRGRDLVTAAMSSPVEVTGPGEEVAVVAERMLAGHLRAMPVVEEGLLIGVVSRRDLLRTMVRDDDVIAGKVRCLLDDYAGSRRHWAVEVSSGVVTIRGDFADEAEKSVVAALARTVAGAASVDLAATTLVSLGWDD